MHSTRCKLIIVCLLAFSQFMHIHAALRARYSSYMYLSGTKPAGQAHTGSSIYMDYTLEKMVEGIWDGWDNATGFDNVNDSRGDITNAPQVHATYWVDSIGQDRSSPLALFSGWAGPGAFLDTSYRQSAASEAIWVAGGLKIDSPGKKQIGVEVGTGGCLYIDLDRDGVINYKLTTDLVMGARRIHNDGIAFDSLKTRENSPVTKEVDFPSAGIYKVLFYLYHHSEISFSKMYMEGQVIPASLWGKKKGPPRAVITDITAAGSSVLTGGSGSVGGCKAITFKGEAIGTFEQGKLEYYWDFDGNGTWDDTTATGTTTWTFGSTNTSMAFPAMSVKRTTDNVISLSSAASGSIIILDVLPCNASILNPVRGKAAISIVGTTLLFTTGLESDVAIRVLDLHGRLVKSIHPAGTRISLSELGLGTGMHIIQIVKKGRNVASFSALLNR